MKPEINVIIVDNHDLFIEGLVAIFENSKIHVAGKTDCLKGLISILQRTTKIDVILLDLNLEKEDGFEIIDFLKGNGFQQKIIVLTMYDSQRIIAKIRTKNIDGFILKNTSKNTLIDAIVKVTAGESYFDTAITEPHYLEPEIKYSDDFIKKHNLNKREYEVLILLAKSFSTKEIAHLLSISEQTVSTYRKFIKSKLKLKSIADIVRYAFVNRLL